MNLPEYLSDGAWDVARRLFATVFRLLIDTGGQSIGIRFGQDDVSTAAAVSGTATVTHGLGRTPVCVLATDGADGNGITNVTVTAVGPTQFTLAIRFTDGVARTTTHGVHWLVIG